MSLRRLLTTALLVVTAVTVVAASSAAPDARQPRIVSAAMQDADGDSRADALRLTYSERVLHRADRDGRYPFQVTGYTIRTVGAASRKTIVLRLVENAAADDTARPTVRYRRVRAGSVVDRAGNQAAVQLFRATRAHGKRPAATPPPPPPPAPPPPPPPPPPQPVTDRDGDGVVDAQDCGPMDPKIKPGAPDAPDLNFIDSNCDGIDGDERNAIFASPQGKDTNPGTKAAPKQQLGAAVTAAAAARKNVYAAAGAYPRVEVATGVAIYGGYDPKTWKRSLALETSIQSGPEGVYAAGATNVLLQLLTVHVVDTGFGAGASIYGIRAVNGSKLALQKVTIRTGRPADGRFGRGGEPGADGAPGGNGAVGAKNCADGLRRPGGAGGDSAIGRPGGKGGDGGNKSTGGKGLVGGLGRFATAGGVGGKGGSTGKQAGNGTSGENGTAGEPGLRGDGAPFSTALAAATWRGANGGSGRIGGAGNGGGGGGGGGWMDETWPTDNWPGSGGGGGGGGGGPGGAGDGGGFGGGSFGVYLFDSSIVADSSSITAANGANGGKGGDGGRGGYGGAGGRDVGFPCGHGGRGGAGGRGGEGGTGGGGGGGAGGPSIGVMKVGTSTATLTNTTIKVGTPGAGGATGGGGNGPITPAQPGIARAVYP